MNKFRAWDTYHNKMVYDIGIYHKPGESRYIFPSKESGMPEILINISENKRFIVMQFSGLKDKAGADIWEGDVINYSYIPEGEETRKECIGEVKFGNGGFFCSAKNLFLGLKYGVEIEVLGSKYERGILNAS